MKPGWLLIAFAIGCAAKDPNHPPPPPLPSAEVKRAEDACQAYVHRACTCTSPAAQRQCELAKALPAAMRLALDVAMNPASLSQDVARAQVSIRETVKECIEQTAKLPAVGCP